MLRAHTVGELRSALAKAKASDRTTVVHVETDPYVDAPDSDAWWDVPVAEVSTLHSRDRPHRIRARKLAQRHYL